MKKAKAYDAIISAVPQSVHKSIDLQEVIENAAQAISENMPKVNHIAVYMVEGEDAVIKAHRGFPDWFIERARRIPYPKGFTWKTIIEGKPRYVADVDKDTAIGPAGREMGIKSYVSMPIRSQGKTVGCININSFRKNAFTKEEINLLGTVAQQIEIGIGNAQQAEALREAHGELESRVKERTAELEKVNEALQIEITERKKMEEMLRENEERYRNLFENIPIGVYRTTPDGRILMANPVLVQMLGYSSFEELAFRNLESEGYESDYPRARFKEIIENEEEIRGLESAWVRRDGSVIYVRENARAVRGDDGAVLYYEGTVEDITERRRGGETLKQISRRMEMILNSAGEGIFGLDTNGNVTFINPSGAKMIGWEAEEIIGKHQHEIIHHSKSDGTPYPWEECPAYKTLRGDTVHYNVEEVFWRKDGTSFPIEFACAPIQEGDNLAGVVITFSDITDRKKIEEERLRYSKLESVGILAGGIAHDFNNLLTAILSTISSTKMDSPLSTDAYENLTEAEKMCIQAKRLTQQLLTFSRGGAPVKKLTSIEQIIRESVSFALRGSNARCEMDIEEGLWDVEVDQGQISQAITNLLINADQSMPQGGTINVTARNINVEAAFKLALIKEGKYVKITVEDSGAGIPKEHLSRIFDPYFTTKQKGSGLGLTTAYSIIKNHNGFIDVESHLGKGTKFYVYIPASDKRVKEQRQEQRKALRGKGRVLIMDDEAIIRRSAGKALSRMGYEVEYASDGEEAIEQYTRAKEENRGFDAVIMDLTIPGGMGGRETIEKLINIDPQVRAIVSSGYSNDPVMSEFKNYGFRSVLPKPYSIEELTETLHKAMEE